MTRSNDPTPNRDSLAPSSENSGLNDISATALPGEWARLVGSVRPPTTAECALLLELEHLLGDTPGEQVIDELSKLLTRCGGSSEKSPQELPDPFSLPPWLFPQFSEILRDGLLPLLKEAAPASQLELQRITLSIIRHVPLYEIHPPRSEINNYKDFFNYIRLFSRSLNPEYRGQILVKLGAFFDDWPESKLQKPLVYLLVPSAQVLAERMTVLDFEALCDLARKHVSTIVFSLATAITYAPKELGARGISALLTLPKSRDHSLADIAQLAAKSGNFENLNWISDLLPRLKEKLIGTYSALSHPQRQLPSISTLCSLVPAGEITPHSLEKWVMGLYGSALGIAASLCAHLDRYLEQHGQSRYRLENTDLLSIRYLGSLGSFDNFDRILDLFNLAATHDQNFTIQDISNFGDEIATCLSNYYKNSADIQPFVKDFAAPLSQWITPAVNAYGFHAPSLLNLAMRNGSGPTDLSRLTEHEISDYFAAQENLSPDDVSRLKGVLNRGASYVCNNGYARGLLLNMIQPRALGPEPQSTRALLDHYQNTNLSPALRLPGEGVCFSVAAQDSLEVSFKERKRADPGLINKIRKFSKKLLDSIDSDDSKPQDALSTVKHKYGIVKIEDIDLPALRKELETHSIRAVEKLNDITPLLPNLLKLALPYVPENNASPGKLRPFYEICLDMVLEPLCSEALPYGYSERLTNAAIPESKILLLDLRSKVKHELSKFKVNATYRGTRQIAMAISKGPLDAFYGELGDCCANTHYECELERPDFQPVRLFDPNTFEQVGVNYTFTRMVDGHPALIVAGILPKRDFANSVSKEELVKEVVKGLKAIALENGLVDSHGVPAVYTNTGGPNWGRADGRIAQMYELHKIIRQLTIAEHQQQATQLDGNQVIAFPSVRADEPIQWVARFA